MSFIGVMRSNLDTFPDEMYMEKEGVVFKIHSKGYFEYDPLYKSKKTGVIHDEGADRKKKKKLDNESNKGKEKVFEDEGMCSKGKKVVVTIYKRGMVNGKEKMVEDISAEETKRHKGVVIGDNGFNNVRWKEEVVSKRGVGSGKMEGTSEKVKSE
nr:hypothetical protein [Tanacetum cinerariifolium]